MAAFQHIVIRQSGHGARVARGHYAIDGAFLHRLGPELLTVYELASVAWHGLLGLKSEGVGGSPAGMHRRAASQQLIPGSEKRLKPWSNASSNPCNSPQPSSNPFSSPPIPRESRNPGASRSSPQVMQDKAMTALKCYSAPREDQNPKNKHPHCSWSTNPGGHPSSFYPPAVASPCCFFPWRP